MAKKHRFLLWEKKLRKKGTHSGLSTSLTTSDGNPESNESRNKSLDTNSLLLWNGMPDRSVVPVAVRSLMISVCNSAKA